MKLLALLQKGGWWTSFAVLVAAVVVFSVVVGHYLVGIGVAHEAGRTATGEWADRSDHGFRARLDSLTMATSLASAYDASLGQMPPEGMVFLRVRMTLEPWVGPDEGLDCRLALYNGDGEELTLTESGLEGPEHTGCLFLGEVGVRSEGVAFQTQTVFVVVPEPVEAYELRLYSMATDQRSYWTFTA